MDYNEKFISDYEEKKYLQCLLDPKELESVLRNYNKRYMNEKVDGEKMLFQESLNHYVVKKIKESRDFVNTPYFINYKKYLQDGLYYTTGFFFHNVFFHSFTQQEIYQMVGRDIYNRADILSKTRGALLRKINEKIKKGEDLSQEELNFICDVYAFNRNENNEYHERLIAYIFKNLTNPNSKLICNKFVLDTLLAYIPKSFFRNNGFNPLNSRVIADDKNIKGPGSSHGTKAVFMNREMFSSTSFKCFDDAKKTYMKRGNDITFLMIVANHELVHQYQEYMSKKKYFSNEGYMKIKATILNSEFGDYRLNHDNDDIEVDATEKGWEICAGFYEKFIPDETVRKELVNQCHANSRGTALRRFDYAKKDEKLNVVVDTDFYDVSKLNEIMKRKPEYLKKFPMLQTFYKEDGRVNLDFLKKSGICTESIAADYICHLCMYSSYRIRSYLVSLNEADLNTALSNINYGFSRYKKKIIYWYQSYESEHKRFEDKDKKTKILEQYNKCMKLYKTIMLILSDKELSQRKSYLESYKKLLTDAMDLTTRQYQKFETSIQGGMKM